ncbi:MAG TPA: phosphoribosylamine--glycine ligase, partial [Candidatus Binatus sp.]|nr:phosphoribosylamine--glycine ligase [Candidatus Binatus sp.]
MKTLVIGSGGREHALSWSLSRDSQVDRVYAAPGNPGIAEVAKCVEINTTNTDLLVSFAKKEKIDLTVVGPEQPLSTGIVDRFREEGLRIFGPDKAGAQIETSKSFAKELCLKHKIPSPKWEVFSNPEQAIAAMDDYGPPWVVKADGLAMGKGTTVTSDRDEALEAIRREAKRPPGRVLLEEFIDGWEATFMATVSSDRIQWLTPVFQDYKPVHNQDTGPNTGGMGCYNPVPAVSKTLLEQIKSQILQPTVDGLRRIGIHYQGVLNLNAFIDYDTGIPYVLEFNARFGDPEAQGVMKLVGEGLADHLSAVADNESIVQPPVSSTSNACVVVVVASKG